MDNYFYEYLEDYPILYTYHGLKGKEHMYSDHYRKDRS